MNLPQEAMPLPEKPMKLHENTINPPQSFDTFLTILDYTSSSGEKFRLQKVKNDPLGRDCAYLDTTTALFVEYGDKQMGKLSEKINNIKGIAIVSFIHKYRVYLQKGDLFEWSEIAEQIWNLLEERFEYTSLSGKKFQLEIIKNDSLGRDCAFLDTNILLYENYQDEKMIALANKMKSIHGVVQIFFINKFRLHIEKGNFFDWEKIAMQVIKFLEKTLEQEESGEC
jgi:hypothetical protein